MALAEPTWLERIEAHLADTPDNGEEILRALPTAKRRGPGRPREIQNPDRLKTEVEQEIGQAFRAIAEKKGISLREAMREAIQGYVDTHRL